MMNPHGMAKARLDRDYNKVDEKGRSILLGLPQSKLECSLNRHTWRTGGLELMKSQQP